MKNFTVFTRTLWKNNPNWPNGLEPHLGRKTILRKGLTFEEARQVAESYNNSHNPGRFSRKAEISSNL